MAEWEVGLGEAAIHTMNKPQLQSGQYISQRALEILRIPYENCILVDIHWIAAHVGVAGTEKVDAPSKEATDGEKLVNYGLTFQAKIKRSVTQSVNKRWNAEWGEKTQG